MTDNKCTPGFGPYLTVMTVRIAAAQLSLGGGVIM